MATACLSNSYTSSIDLSGSQMMTSQINAAVGNDTVSVFLYLYNANHQPYQQMPIVFYGDSITVVSQSNTTNALGLATAEVRSLVPGQHVLYGNVVLESCSTLVPASTSVYFYSASPYAEGIPAGTYSNLHISEPSLAYWSGNIRMESTDNNAILPAEGYVKLDGLGRYLWLQGIQLCHSGSQTISFYDANTSQLLSTSTYLVAAVSPAELKLSNVPNQVVAGFPLTGSLSVYDRFGNIVIDPYSQYSWISSDILANQNAKGTVNWSNNNSIATWFSGFTATGNQQLAISNQIYQSLFVPVEVFPQGLDHFQIQSALSQVAAGQVFDVNVIALDVFGNRVTGTNASLIFSCTDSNAVLPDLTAMTAKDSGLVQINNVSLFQAGVQFLTATDVVSGTMSQPFSLSVLNDAAVQIVLTTPTVSYVASENISLTVSLYDQYFNLVSDYQGTILFQSSDPLMTSSGRLSYSFSGADRGEKSFQNAIQLYTKGFPRIKVFDVDNVNLYDSLNVQITSLNADHLLLSVPSGILLARQEVPLTLRSLDKYNNTVYPYNGNFIIQSTDGNAVLGVSSYSDLGNSNDYLLTGVVFQKVGFQSLTLMDALVQSIQATVANFYIHDLKEVTLGSYHVCALIEDGEVKCWGENNLGQLGQGDITTRGLATAQMGNGLSAVQLGSQRQVRQLTSKYHHTCVVLDNNDLKCFGDNESGQLGYGDTSNRGDQQGSMGDALPAVQVASGLTVQQVTTGYGHSCVLLDNAAIQCFGSNNSGQLGYEDQVDRYQCAIDPISTTSFIDLGLGDNRSPSVNILQLVAGNNFNCALTEDYRIFCWGANDSGQLGLGDNTPRGGWVGSMGAQLPPSTLPTGDNAMLLSAGDSHACAVAQSGNLYCWGNNDSGQLGYGDTLSRNSIAALQAVFVGHNLKVKTVSAGYKTTCLVLDNGLLKCLGDNSQGKLGLGLLPITYSSVGGNPQSFIGNLPSVDLGASNKAQATWVGGQYTACALLVNGFLKCWGDNSFGQLGLGDGIARGSTAQSMGDFLPTVSLW